MNIGTEVSFQHEMRIEFTSTDIALSCFRYLKEKYPELSYVRMDWKDGKVIVILGMRCSVSQWIDILKSFE